MIKQFQGEYRWLSNFWPVDIQYQGMVYPSVEHAYMSAKSDNANWKEFCADPFTPAGRVKMRSKNVLLVDNWDILKVVVMNDCLIEKFKVPYLREALLATGDQILQEGNNWGDRFWGVDLRTGEGNNHLGQILMAIREQIKIGAL